MQTEINNIGDISIEVEKLSVRYMTLILVKCLGYILLLLLSMVKLQQLFTPES